MSTVKISGMTPLANVTLDPSNTVIPVVDMTTLQNYKLDARSLGSSLYSNNTLQIGRGVAFPDNSSQNTAAAPYSYSNSAYAVANTNQLQIIYLGGALNSANSKILNNSANTIYIQGAINTANTNIATNSANTVYLQGALNTANSNSANNLIRINAAYNVANGALQNTSGVIFGGNLTVSGTIQINSGIVYTPNITNSVTALTIDFSKDTVRYATGTAGLTVSMTNYTSGKEVILWFVNNAGSTQTVTHGCLANNSTIKNTSFSMPSLSTAYLRYFSFDGTLSNTFVAITHA